MDSDSPLKSPRRRERAAREERLAKALRENLRRRKEQARAQEERHITQEGKCRGTGATPVS